MDRRSASYKADIKSRPGAPNIARERARSKRLAPQGLTDKGRRRIAEAMCQRMKLKPLKPKEASSVMGHIKWVRV